VGLAVYLLSVAVAKARQPETHQAQPGGTEQPRLAWWLEVKTTQPRCTYYFGPFTSAKEAEQLQGGYLEDLDKEGAKGITAQAKWCQPAELTIIENEFAEAS
ncbi:MAG TPA: DUF1816 domain-containing protein, partial [Candidatus Caenarcaniphilales bacterium]